MKLNPFTEEDAVKELLDEAIGAPVDRKITSAPDSLRKALNSRKGTIDEVAANMVDLMHNAENENVRLSASKMIAAAHGALSDMLESAPPVINITIEGNSGQQAINILMPQVRIENDTINA